MKLSIVIPVYNEQETLLAILDKVENAPLPDAVSQREILLIDDFSTDGTRQLIRDIDRPHVRAYFHEKNQGKGAALRTGFSHATGDIILIQDADLEYNPQEYPKLLKPILEQNADVVYGSRFLGGAPHRILYFWHSVGNKFLTLLSNMLSDLNLSDMETCYKVFRREIIQRITIEENRFGFEPEVTAKISAMNRETPIKIYEVGISYDGRTYEEGKKIGASDGFRALWCILKYNTSTAANFIKYSFIGTMVALFQVLSMIVLVEAFDWRTFAKLDIAHAVSIELTILVAFFLHSLVTWRQKEGSQRSLIKLFFLFHAATIFSFALRVALFYFLIRNLAWGYVAVNLIGVAAAVIPNFYWYNRFFRIKKPGKKEGENQK